MFAAVVAADSMIQSNEEQEVSSQTAEVKGSRLTGDDESASSGLRGGGQVSVITSHIGTSQKLSLPASG